MFERKGLVRMAACALLVCGGIARAAEPTPQSGLIGSDTQPKLLAEAPARTPLMGVLDQVGIGKMLDNAGITVTGLVQGGVTYGANSPTNNLIGGRGFDVENQDPTLNQLVISIDKAVDMKKAWDIGGRVKFIYGGDSRFIHSNGLFDHPSNDVNAPLAGLDNQWDLTEAYVDVSVPVGNGLLVRVGKFVAPQCYEVIDPSGNPFYSHSYLFNFGGPATLTGITGTYQLSDQLSVMGGITRGWNQSLEDNNDVINVIAGANWTSADKKTKAALVIIVGPEQTGNTPGGPGPGVNSNGDYTDMIDLVVTQRLSDQLTVGAEVEYCVWTGADLPAVDGGEAMFYGVAGYASYTVDKYVTVNGRLEFFRDEDNFALGGLALVGNSTNIWEGTLGVTITPLPDHALGKNLKVRPEVRLDYCDDNVFDPSKTTGLGTQNWQLTFGIDAIFTF